MEEQLRRLTLMADASLFNLGSNSYPGRGMVVGLAEDHLVQVYWIMGRSENSRNRVFSFDAKEGRLYTEAADASKVKDPSLIIYNAMREVQHRNITYHVVSNGSQTDVVAKGYADDIPMRSSLHGIQYEPDAPNFTPRITASSRWERGEPIIKMSLLRKSPFSDKCCRHLFEIEGIGDGFGHCLTTYRMDGNPLPPFRGEPYPWWAMRRQ